MTQLATARNFAKLWTQSDATSEILLKKFLLAGLDTMGEKESDLLAKIRIGPQATKQTVTWLEEEDYPTSVQATLATSTLTFSGTLFNSTMTVERLNQIIRVDTILERESDGMQCRVTSTTFSDPATYTAAVAAWGNNSLSNDNSGATTYRIISELWTDFKDVDMTRMKTRFPREVGTQIFQESFEMAQTQENTDYEVVSDEWIHQTDSLLKKLRRQEVYSAFRMEPYYSSGYKFGNQTEKSSMCSVLTWPKIVQAESANTDVYVNLASAELTKTHLDDLARNMYLTENADFGSGDWWIVCHPLVHRFIADWDVQFRQMTKGDKSVGFMVDTFDAKIGKRFPIISDRVMRPNVVLICNFSTMSRGYFKNDKMNKKELSTQGRYRRWMVSFQGYGVVCRKPRHIGMLYNVATS
jgi:hypothetical protein